MRLIFGLVLVVGVGLASFAVYMAKDYIGAYQAELARERATREQIVPTVEVVVINRQVAYGEQITPEDVRAVKWPETAIPEGAFVGIDAVFPDGEKELRTALRTMEKDEALLAIKVTEPGEDAGVSSRLTRGMRAFAIRVDVASGVSGFLRPGDRVDVYWSGRLPTASNEGEQEVTQLIQSGVRLIAVDQTADGDRRDPTIARTVTVEATPLQVAALAQAQSTGSLSLSLLGNLDDTIVNEDVAINQNALLGIQNERVVEAQQKEVCTIRTRRGGDIIETPIPCTN
jgi:pilus assembly protein CpaB